MKKSFVNYLCILGGVFPSALLSLDAFAQPSAACKPSGYQQLLKCLIEQSADIRISDQQLKATSELDGVARRWINPELSAENVQRSGNQSETTASLLFNIRLGGKRSAAINEARGEIDKAAANRDLNVAQAKLDIALRLYEISHLNGEIKIEEESVQTFSKIVGQYQKKPALSPDQQVSLSVFKMSLADHQLNLTKIRNDQEKIVQELVSSSGVPREIILGNLPGPRKNWPEIAVGNEVKASPHMRYAAGEVQIARSQKEKANAESWPDLKIGPAMRIVKNGANSDNFYGAAISIPLPVFSVNKSGRAYGQEKLVEAEMEYEFTQRKVNSLREQLIKKYRETVAVLNSSLSTQVIEDRHEQMEKLFFKGVVPSSLVIEAHRQLIDLEQKKNESIRAAIEALGSIYIIDNTFSEVPL